MPQDAITTYLTSSRLSKAQRADAWDAFEESADADALAARLQSMSMPQSVKADLWDLKSTGKLPQTPTTGSGILDNALNLAGGIRAGVASTMFHGGDLIRRGLGMERVIDTPEVQAAMTPPPGLGKLGYYAEQGAEFALPLAGVAKATKAAPMLARMGAEGAAAAGVAGLQSGGDTGAMVLGGTLGALAPPVGAGISATARIGKQAAQGFREGGVGGAISGAMQTVKASTPEHMLVQGLKPRASKVRFDDDLARALPEIKQAERVIGKPIEGVDDMLTATQAAKKRIWGQYEGLLGPAKQRGTTVDLSPVADAIERSLPRTLSVENPDVLERLVQTAQVYRQRFKVQDVEQLLREANAELDAYFAKFPAARQASRDANPEIAQTVAKSKVLRDELYKALDGPGEGAAARELKRRYGALSSVEDELYRRANVAARQQPESLSEQIGKVHAASRYASGLFKMTRGLAFGNPGAVISGGADIAAAKAGRETAIFLKEQQTADALIRRAMKEYAGTPAPIIMPKPPTIRGQLGPGARPMGPPPDPSGPVSSSGEYPWGEYGAKVPPEPPAGPRQLPPAPSPRGLLPPPATPLGPATPQPNYAGLPWNLRQLGPATEAPTPAPAAAPQPSAPASRAPGVSKDDIPYNTALRAYEGTSHFAERRAASTQDDYIEHMEKVWDDLSGRATTTDQQAEARAQFDRYRTNYAAKYREYLGSRQGLVSSFIAGPSKFPARRMNKKSDQVSKKLSDFLDWDKRAQKAMVEAVDPSPPSIISADRPDAPDALQQEIAQARKLQDAMRAANNIVRSKATDEEKIARMVALGLKEATARKALSPDFAGRKGFPDYALRNNLANIKRMEGRVASIQATRARPEGSAEFEGGRVEENASNNRVQVFFDAKPDEAMRAKLKAIGFRWAPSQGAWQRQRTDNAIDATERLLGVKLRAADAPTPAAVETPAAPPKAVEPPKPTVPPLTREEWLSQVGDPADTLKQADALEAEALKLWQSIKGKLYRADNKPRVNATLTYQEQEIRRRVDQLRAEAGELKQRASAQRRMREDYGSHMRPEPNNPAYTEMFKMFGRDEARAAAAMKQYQQQEAARTTISKTAKPQTPATAAAEVRSEIQRVIETKGAKNAADVQRRVMAALEEELEWAAKAQKFGEVEIRPRKAYGGREFDVWIGGNPVVDVDRYGKMSAHYGVDDSMLDALGAVRPDEKAAKYGGKATLGSLAGGRDMTPSELHRKALAEFSARVSRASGAGRITIQIPGDGTFTIERNPHAIRELIARVKAGGPSAWGGLAVGEKKAAAPTAEGVIRKAWKPTW